MPLFINASYKPCNGSLLSSHRHCSSHHRPHQRRHRRATRLRLVTLVRSFGPPPGVPLLRLLLWTRPSRMVLPILLGLRAICYRRPCNHCSVSAVLAVAHWFTTPLPFTRRRRRRLVTTVLEQSFQRSRTMRLPIPALLLNWHRSVFPMRRLLLLLFQFLFQLLPFSILVRSLRHPV
jgi:hypothetical protein